MNNKDLLKNMGMSALYKPISMLISFVYVPVVLRFLGSERYGVWATVLSILSWISYFDIGIGNGLRNKLTEKLAVKASAQECRKIISSAYVMLFSIIIIFMIFTVLVLAQLNFSKLLSAENIADNVQAAVIISILFASFNFGLSLVNSILYALQKAHLVAFSGVLSQTLILIFTLAAGLYTETNLLTIAIVYGGCNLFVQLVISLYVFLQKKDWIPSVSEYNRNYARETTSLGLKFFVLQVSAIIILMTDNLIIAKLYGPNSVTQYTTLNKGYMVIAALVTALMSPLWSAFTAAKGEGNYDWIEKIIKKMFKLIPLVCIACIIFGLLFRKLSIIWLNMDLNYPKGLIPLMGVYVVVYIWCSACSLVTNGLEMMKVAVGVGVVQGIVNIPLSLFFAIVLDFKVCGVLLGTVCSMMIAAIIVPFEIKKYLKVLRGK